MNKKLRKALPLQFTNTGFDIKVEAAGFLQTKGWKKTPNRGAEVMTIDTKRQKYHMFVRVKSGLDPNVKPSTTTIGGPQKHNQRPPQYSGKPQNFPPPQQQFSQHRKKCKIMISKMIIYFRSSTQFSTSYTTVSASISTKFQNAYPGILRTRV